MTSLSGLFNSQNLKLMLIGMIVLFIIMCVIIIILVFKNSKLQNQIEDLLDSGTIPPEEIEGASQGKLYNEVETAQQFNYDPATMSRNKGYAVNEDTGEILLEHPDDNNASVKVPPMTDEERKSIQDVMKERPFGIDSAFEVVSAGDEEAKARFKELEAERIAREEEEKKRQDILSGRIQEEVLPMQYQEKAEAQRRAFEEAERAKRQEEAAAQEGFQSIDENIESEKKSPIETETSVEDQTKDPTSKDFVPQVTIYPGSLQDEVIKALQEKAPVEEETPVEETAPVQEEIPVEKTALVEEEIPVEKTAPVEETVPVLVKTSNIILPSFDEED